MVPPITASFSSYAAALEKEAWPKYFPYIVMETFLLFLERKRILFYNV